MSNDPLFKDCYVFSSHNTAILCNQLNGTFSQQIINWQIEKCKQFPNCIETLFSGL